MRLTRGIAALAVLFSSATLGTCVYPTEQDDAVRVTIDPLPVLIRGTDTYATARAWQFEAAGESMQIGPVRFVWSCAGPLLVAVTGGGRLVYVHGVSTT